MAGRGIWTSSFQNSLAPKTHQLLKLDLLAHNLNRTLSHSLDLRNLNHGNHPLKGHPTGRPTQVQVRMAPIDLILRNMGRHLGTRQHSTISKVELQAHSPNRLSQDHKPVTNRRHDSRHRDHSQRLQPLPLNHLDLPNHHRLHWIRWWLQTPIPQRSRSKLSRRYWIRAVSHMWELLRSGILWSGSKNWLTTPRLSRLWCRSRKQNQSRHRGIWRTTTTYARSAAMLPWTVSCWTATICRHVWTGKISWYLVNLLMILKKQKKGSLTHFSKPILFAIA